MSEHEEIVLVIDDATFYIWRDKNQWKNADTEHKDAARKYWIDNKDRLSAEIDEKLKADARRYYHENKERLNAYRKNIMKSTRNKNNRDLNSIMNKTKTELMKQEGIVKIKRKGTSNIIVTIKKASMLQNVSK